MGAAAEPEPPYEHSCRERKTFGVFRNGLALAGLQNIWQELTVGLLIIVAVALDQWIRRLSE